MNTVDLISRQEGFRGMPYDDSLGKPTIGYGTLLPITEDEGQLLLASRLDPILKGLQINLPWFNQLDGVREAAMLSWAYQLGVAGVMAFHHALDAIEAHDWQHAYDAMLDSLWAKQTPARAAEVAGMILNGRWPGEGGDV